MTDALVIHPVMSYYAGGEYVCLNVCQALQEMDFHVTLASDVFDPITVEKLFSLGTVLSNCKQVKIPQFTPSIPRFSVAQRILYQRKIWPLLEKLDAKVAFSTQSSPFFLCMPTVHFVYNVADLFGYPPDAAPALHMSARAAIYNRLLLGASRRFLWENHFTPPAWYYAVGSGVLSDLRQLGHENSSLLLPPSRVSLRPSSRKRKQVVQAARVIPDKRLETFIEIASKLPEYNFFLLARTTAATERQYPDYAQEIFGNVPPNVTVVEGSVRDRADLLEDSMVYLYTGIERGIVLTIAEAMSAGCVPLSPPNVGAADIIREAGIGFLYRDADEASAKIRSILEAPLGSEQIKQISQKARAFSPEAFRDKIRQSVSTIGYLS